ncbi:hypothetical protein DIPPA_24248 [Diplonema papillatum]|nr:hypothetical protein DIPPA_24248 [Diplonema papillatum]
MSIFDVAESSWWARSLYSLMRLDASYPDATAVTAEEVGLLASLFVGAALAVGLCWTSLRSLVFKGNLAAAAPVVLIAAAGFWGKVQVQTNFGAYDLAPRVTETVPNVHNATHATFRTDYFGLPVVGRAIIPTELRSTRPADGSRPNALPNQLKEVKPFGRNTCFGRMGIASTNMRYIVDEPLQEKPTG